MSRGAGRNLRCAIYTRKSTEEGLEQDFNSLHAQREACEAYIKSQKHEGWHLIPAKFDDGGFSGGSMDRPALTKLLEDIQSGLVDVVVVYKVDRLTRSLTDFARIVDVFDRHGVSFVSVTQAFNTTTSMGRLTLNVLLSFAQFEREVTGERIRDKIAASKRKGMWMGGVVPLGYQLQNRKLEPHPTQADTVRFIFKRYLELASVPALQRDLLQRGIRTREQQLASGGVRGGVPFTNGPLGHMLRNRIYLGEIKHKEVTYPGEHEPIIDRSIFDAVQAQLARNQLGERGPCHASGALLRGRIFDDRGNRMTPVHAKKGAVRYRYYVSSPHAQGWKEASGTVSRVSAPEIEEAVISALQAEVDQAEVDRTAIARLVDRVVVMPQLLEIWPAPNERARVGHIPIIVPWTRPSHPRKRAVLAAPGAELSATRPLRAEARARLLTAIARARRWVDDLVEGRATSTHELAQRHGISERSVRMTLSLAFAAPALVKAVIEGRLRRGVGVTTFTELPLSWPEQLSPLLAASDQARTR